VSIRLKNLFFLGGPDIFTNEFFLLHRAWDKAKWPLDITGIVVSMLFLTDNFVCFVAIAMVSITQLLLNTVEGSAVLKSSLKIHFCCFL